MSGVQNILSLHPSQIGEQSDSLFARQLVWIDFEPKRQISI